MSSRSETSLFTKMPLRLWPAQANWHCSKRAWSRRTSKPFSQATSYTQSILRNWEKQLVWVRNAPRCWPAERPSVGHWHARHALRFTLRGYPPGIIVYAWARVGFLKALRRDRCCRWGFRGSYRGEPDDKISSFAGAANNGYCFGCVWCFFVGAREERRVRQRYDR